MDDVFTPPPLPTGQRGSTFCSATRMTRVDRLTCQLEDQEQIVAAAGSLAASLREGLRPVPPGLTPPLLVVTLAPMGTPPVGLVRTGVPSTGATQRSTLLSDLALFVGMHGHVGTLLRHWTVLPSPLQTRHWVYPQLQIQSLTAPCIPTNEINDIQGTTMFSMSHRILPGSPGNFWYLQVGFDYLKDQDSKTTMLFGLSALMEILPDAIESFMFYPSDAASTLSLLTNNKPEDGFPSSAALAFKYFLVKNKNNSRGAPQASPFPPKPSPHRHRYNDEEEYKAPTALWGVIKCTCNGNIKEGVEGLAWDIGNTRITIKYKEHQSPKFSAQILLIWCLTRMAWRARLFGILRM